MNRILKCQKCSSYTMKELCTCGGTAVHAKPLKYSPDDAYARYRRTAKFSDFKEKGLI